MDLAAKPMIEECANKSVIEESKNQAIETDCDASLDQMKSQDAVSDGSDGQECAGI